MQAYLAQQKQSVIGFVPTMGALHDGHMSLIRLSREQADLTVCSIFVNPTQFNDAKDFEKYPVTIENDIRLLEQEGCDILFLPGVTDMYPEGTALQQQYDLGFVETVLEGAHRPGHFQGVCQVVHRLLQIVQPQRLFMGQKDYQQCMVVKKLIELTGLPVELVIGATRREPEGLAMSSRNVRLTAQERHDALAIYEALQFLQQNITTYSFASLQQRAMALLHEKGFTKIDYVAVHDAETLAPLQAYQAGRKMVALIAAFKGEVRLIDNLVLNP